MDAVTIHNEYCLRGNVHLRTGMKLIIAVGSAVLTLLTLLLGIYFRKALFILSIPCIVTLLSAAAVFRRDHRFVWPLLGISCFHVFLALNALLIFAFYFFFKPLYIIMVFNWAFDTLDTGKNLLYYLKCFVIVLFLTLFLFYNVWQASVAHHFLQHLRYTDNRLDDKQAVASADGSLAALNCSHNSYPEGGQKHSAIVFVGADLQTTETRNMHDY